ncbi:MULTISPECIES: MarR family transcriptional regulator [unclassified Streptomyces]|jgi:DNA-binding MarR family transcriptional regulator|uniref:MarR family transcriptional regulator n=1 Tax=Streptomyces doudnae TaxID=3075536 RepID=A0ABD5EWT6_9ACTN|nr:MULTISPECIES: MarR family transcriptional regulator [unclassified Streptomyces]MDT0439216.1 MarR family transcriptional regulator [Streptomyces sp. DSM 41981]MYQ65882.1 MarR family transcriptional regulator [Streptomyces sp. SID4950]SCE09439.1 DNA-binding transcriptional regulator, MarR family [Streptomyces sp. SolWspMP-5a-2]
MTTSDSDSQLAEQLLRLTRRVHRIQKRHIEECGLGVTPAQSRLLRTLAHYGSPPRMADLAERLEVVPRAITTLVDGLEAGGKVRRAPDPSNRRVIRVELTEDGRRALGRLRGARRSAAEEILGALSDEQRRELGGLLDTLMDGTTDQHGPETHRPEGHGAGEHGSGGRGAGGHGAGGHGPGEHGSGEHRSGGQERVPH